MHIWYLFRKKCKLCISILITLYTILQNAMNYDIMKRDINRFGISDYIINNVYDIPLANKKNSRSYERRKTVLNHDWICWALSKNVHLAYRRKEDYEEGEKRQEQRCSEIYNVRRLQAVLEWRNRNDEMMHRQSSIRSKLSKCTPY